MYNFFIKENQRQNDCYFIGGTDYNHIKNVLRMVVGDTFLVSENGESHLCEIEKFENDLVVAKIIKEDYNDTGLPIKIYLFQGLPKGDKMELIIQKTVELGVESIIPVEMNRCVVKIDDKKKKSKQQRWQAISESAAKQSKRNTIPQIEEILTYKQAMLRAKEMDLFLVPYESKNGMEDTKYALSQLKSGMSVGILIGPEGGFDEKEVETAFENGGKVVSLGKRILRTETAAIASVSMCMLHAEMYLGE
jgi:16S rRNA (uracil1498-N3)-methyltransferase